MKKMPTKTPATFQKVTTIGIIPMKKPKNARTRIIFQARKKKRNIKKMRH